jgi:hypothetical protein
VVPPYTARHDATQRNRARLIVVPHTQDTVEKAHLQPPLTWACSATCCRSSR